MFSPSLEARVTLVSRYLDGTVWILPPDKASQLSQVVLSAEPLVSIVKVVLAGSVSALYEIDDHLAFAPTPASVLIEEMVPGE